MLSELIKQLEREHESLEMAAETAVTVYKAAKGEMDNLKAVQDQAKGMIGEIMEETGETSITTAAGKAYVLRPSVSVSYDAKALDALCASDDNLARILQPHRRESQRAGTLTIR